MSCAPRAVVGYSSSKSQKGFSRPLASMRASFGCSPLPSRPGYLMYGVPPRRRRRAGTAHGVEVLLEALAAAVAVAPAAALAGEGVKLRMVVGRLDMLGPPAWSVRLRNRMVKEGGKAQVEIVEGAAHLEGHTVWDDAMDRAFKGVLQI